MLEGNFGANMFDDLKENSFYKWCKFKHIKLFRYSDVK